MQTTQSPYDDPQLAQQGPTAWRDMSFDELVEEARAGIVRAQAAVDAYDPADDGGWSLEAREQSLLLSQRHLESLLADGPVRVAARG